MACVRPCLDLGLGSSRGWSRGMALPRISRTACSLGSESVVWAPEKTSKASGRARPVDVGESRGRRPVSVLTPLFVVQAFLVAVYSFLPFSLCTRCDVGSWILQQSLCLHSSYIHPLGLGTLAGLQLGQALADPLPNWKPVIMYLIFH